MHHQPQLKLLDPTVQGKVRAMIPATDGCTPVLRANIQSAKTHTEGLLHQLVVCEGDALLPDLAVATLVDELTDRLQVRVA